MKGAIRFTKDIISNIAQIILVVCFLPAVCWVLSFIDGTQNALYFLFDLIGQVGIFETLMTATTIFTQSGGFSSFTESNELYDALLLQIENLDSSIYQILIVALCVHLLGIVWHIIKGRGMPILFSVLGVIAGTLVNIAWSDMPVVALGFLMLLLFVVDMIFVEDVKANFFDFLGKYFFYCLKLVVEALAVIFITGLIIVLLLIWKGDGMTFKMAAVTITIFTVPTLITLALKRYVFCVGEKL